MCIRDSYHRRVRGNSERNSMSMHDSPSASEGPVVSHPLQASFILVGLVLCSIGFQQRTTSSRHSAGAKAAGSVLILIGWSTLNMSMHGQGKAFYPGVVFVPFVAAVALTAAGLGSLRETEESVNVGLYVGVDALDAVGSGPIHGAACDPAGPALQLPASRQVPHPCDGLGHGSELKIVALRSLLVMECVLTRLCVVLQFACMWIVSDAWESTNAVGNLVGHVLPSAFLTFIVNLPLQFNIRQDYARLQRYEGMAALALGVTMLAIHTTSHHGSMLFYWFTHDLKKQPHSNWMMDQQHTVDLFVWITMGVVALGLLRLGVVTRIHFLLPATTNLLVMVAHEQPSLSAKVMHWAFGILFFCAVLLTLMHRTVEFCWLGTVGAFCFAASTPELTLWADKNFMPMNYLTLYLVGASLIWMFHVTLWHNQSSLAELSTARSLANASGRGASEFTTSSTSLVPSAEEDLEAKGLLIL
eukprot:TRINITY_DN20662_c0_g1_i3.p1 TRINITY_DN20662_c0_g1~~TRINITY_DN20662_c0_g1_i3.p1  ORF type:complete len:472 (+),score=86.10 TRINITY_DN20662_c0_g1_i3:120-1535(+)